ncbi:MAG: hypothetical protein ABWY54_01445 [Glaciihabitans sp.]
MNAAEFDPTAWPGDMRITMSDANNQLYLLFVRSAWRIEHTGVPELEVEPDVGASARPPGVDRLEAQSRWRSEWELAWRDFEPRPAGVGIPDAKTQQLLDTLSDEELWRATSTRPSEYWAAGVDLDAFAAWKISRRPDRTLPLAQHPERVSVSALIAAWRTGLTEIIELPFAGYYAERVDRERLIVSAFTRRDPELYTRALGTPQAQ